MPIYLPPAHYSAPLTAAVFALMLQAMRSMRRWRPNGRPGGRFLVRAVPVICFVLLPLRAAAPLLHIPLPATNIHTWYSADFHNLERARVLAQLREEPGRHLAIVRYRPDHEILEEWVYNESDIDGSKVVWARDMGVERNQELIEYFKGRRVWLVEPDEEPVKLTAYSPLAVLKRCRGRPNWASRGRSSIPMLIIETGFVLLSLLIAFVQPTLGSRWCRESGDALLATQQTPRSFNCVCRSRGLGNACCTAADRTDPATYDP